MSVIIRQLLLVFLLFYHDWMSDALNLLANKPSNYDDSLGLASKELRQTKSVKKSLNNFNYSLSPKYPVTDHQIGQITAVDIDSKGNIVIFHRGLHVWNERSFDLANNYKLAGEGPINITTVIVIEPKTMTRINSWGANIFYLPHGLTFDIKGYVWLTDVALHQVMKFPAEGSDKPTMVLGEKFVPGNDENHFCKPTSVAIDSKSGDIYVADGYCNSRVIRLNQAGKFLNQWGKPDLVSRVPPPNYFNIVHKVVLIEELNIVCAADREHGRILCFNYLNGEFSFMIAISEFSGRLFSISYSSFGGGVLFAVNGAGFYDPAPVKGFLFNLTTRELLTSFGSFKQPHDIVATPDAENVYIVEIGPNLLWKFVKEVPIELSNMPDVTTAKKLTPLKSDTLADRSTSFHPKSPLIPSPIASLSSTSVIILILVVSIILVIFLAFLIACRRNHRPNNYSPLHEIKGWITGYRATKNELNLGRILHDPKRSGFNQLAMDESDNEAELINGEIHSESEVEEFNVSSVRKI